MALACSTAQAQDISFEPGAAQRCLQHSAGPDTLPDFPSAAYNANRGGRVQVALTFSAPDKPPQMLVLLHEGEQDILDAVKDHVRGLRVPCLASAAAPAQLNQDYVFQPDQRRVHWANTADASEAARRGLFGCLSHRSGQRAPEYPSAAVRMQAQGRVLARLRFSSPTLPPEVEVFSRQRDLARHVQDWALDYRLPCLQGDSVEGVMTYLFKIEGERFGFKDVGFFHFLSLAKDIGRQTLAFDTTTMGCPFDLRVHYRRPDMVNDIGEVGARVAARRPLLDWLAQAELDLPPRQLDAVYGDSFKLTVPCTRIDLKPKEKS